MESRKRPYPDTEEASVTKRRVMADSTASPHINGTHVEQDEPREGDNLELFRKEAIYRRMKYYSRENERCQIRIAELERRKNTCEAGLATFSACWAQLVDTIRLLIKPDLLPQVNVNAQDIINLTANFQSATPNALETVLEEHMAATKSLMSKFVDLDEAARFQQDHGDVYAECQKAKTECISLRLQIDDMQHKLQDSESQKERYHAALRVAENQVERLRSTTLNAIHQAATKKQKTKHDTPEESIKPPSPAEAQSSANGTYEPIEGDALQEILKLRDARIAEVEKELAALREKKLALELEVRSAMPEYLATNQYYKYLYDQTGTLQVTVEAQRERIAKLTEELRNSLATRKEWEESFVNSMSQSMNELKSMVMKRDAEIARIRDQRDIAQAEIVERKHLESLKVGSTDEVKKMVESRGERIAVLESELRRLRAQLAAHARDEDLMLFFCNGKEDLQEYIQDLKDRLKQAEARSSAMEDTLRLLDQNHPDIAKHMRAEAEARQMLEKVIEDLQRYKSAYGDLSTLPPEAAQLAQQLSQRDEELQRLRLLDRQREQSEMSLYTEIDKLSAAWEALDKQLKGKIFDLTAMEEKLAKGTLDRAKLENKYYAAMRDKEATESERKNLARNNEKQAKAIERMVDAERNLAAQLNSAEKEIAGLRQITDLSKQKIDDLEKTLKEAQMRLESEQTRMNELYALVRDRERALDVKKQDLRKMEESLIKSKKAIEKQAAKQGQANPEDSDDVYLNHLLSILKCSTCKVHFRNTVITKCKHSFCKDCLDARIATRQRKCPACGIAFAQSDVQGIYFQ